MNLQEQISRIKGIMGLKESFLINSDIKNNIEKALGKDFLTIAETHPDFVLLPSHDVKRKQYVHGELNKCETNSFNYVLGGIKKDKKIYPVGGYAFTESYFPIEHWWVYDADNDIFLEVTPFEIDDIICYAGVIGYDVRQQMIDSKAEFNKPYDKVDFFKGGYIQFKYFQ